MIETNPKITVPEITVIMPVYNSEPFLKQSVNSILSQTFTHFELLLINDGSTDGSPEICDYFAKKDCRVKAVHRKNQGVSQTRNHGLDIAAGRYIVFCDSDDLYDKNAFQCMYHLMQQYSVDLVISGYRRFYDDTKTPPKYSRVSPYPVTIFPSKKELSVLFTKPDTNLFGISIWGKLYRADIIQREHIRFPDGILYEEDCVFNLQYYRQISSVAANNNIFYHYRQRAVSLSKGYKASTYPFLINGWQHRRTFFTEVGASADISKLDAIFMMVMLDQLRRIFASFPSRKDRIAEYRKILDREETLEVASKVGLSKNLVTKRLTLAVRQLNPSKIDMILTVQKYKLMLQSKKANIKDCILKIIKKRV